MVAMTDRGGGCVPPSDMQSPRGPDGNGRLRSPIRFREWLGRCALAFRHPVQAAAMVAALAVHAGHAQAEPRAVIELFTSQGCSSCPPADRVLGELARDPDVIALSFPVDYWDYLGWKDTLADRKFSLRQRAYSQQRGDRGVYTPQVIVNGVAEVLGSDRSAIENAITAQRSDHRVMTLPVSLALAGGDLRVDIAAGQDAPRGEVWVCAISRSVKVNIKRGENRDHQVEYHNVVRRWLKVGDWSGVAAQWTVPLENIRGEGIDAAVVYVQSGSRDQPGSMLGASYVSLQ